MSGCYQRSAGRRILAFATNPGQDNERLRALLQPVADQVIVYPFDRSRRILSAIGLLVAVTRQRPSVVVMEGTGVAGGIVLLLARLALRTRYVVISGDAVGPFIGARWRWLGPIAWMYELVLLRASGGFIGWTPYLVGRALTLGARRAITAPAWAPPTSGRGAGLKVRHELGIPPGTIVFGIAGSLNWNARLNYCYGCELLRALRRVSRPELAVVIIGDGSGLARLRELAAGDRRVHLVGWVPPRQVPDYLAAFDIASLPQSCDQVGSFRFTTKLPEYLAARLPIVTGQIPMAYDLALDCSWRMPGAGPWCPDYLDGLSNLMETVTADEIASRRPTSEHQARAEALDSFAQRARVTALLEEVLLTQ